MANSIVNSIRALRQAAAAQRAEMATIRRHTGSVVESYDKKLEDFNAFWAQELAHLEHTEETRADRLQDYNRLLALAVCQLEDRLRDAERKAEEQAEMSEDHKRRLETSIEVCEAKIEALNARKVESGGIVDSIVFYLFLAAVTIFIWRQLAALWAWVF